MRRKRDERPSRSREGAGFIGWKDFTTSVENYRGGERRDYHVTIDMAKELAMVERNEAEGLRAAQRNAA